MSIFQDLVAFIELQASGPLFTSIVKLACSAAPNPFPTFDFLAGQRLLVVQRTFPVGTSIRAITRANDGNVAVLTANELVTVSADLRVVSRMTNRGGANLTRTSHGTYLWGPGGAFLVTLSGLRPIVGAAVHAVEIEPAQIVFHSDTGLLAASKTGVARLNGTRIRPTAAPMLGAVFLRLTGQLVMVADGSDLVVAHASRFYVRTQGLSA
jgi:hypothetical protein